MNCEQHAALLEKLWEDAITPEEEARLREHEERCGDCARRRREAELLRGDLDALAQEELPLPEGFHQGWMQLVEQEADNMRKTSEAPKEQRRHFTRFLSLAAAAVFLVGGTLLTRDQLQLTAPSGRTEETSDDAYSGGTSGYTASDALYMSENTRSAGVESYSLSAANRGVEETAESKIIRTVSLSLGSGTFTQDLETLQGLCKEAGGWISYISVSGDEAQASRRASLTLRIPEEKLDAFLQGAGELGRVISQTETAQDVTASYQDIAARLATQQAKMERLQALMSETATLSELLELESAIADTQYTLDSLQSQLNQTDDQVAYATVDVSLREESSADAVTTRELSLGERLLAGLKTGWDTFWSFCKDMLVFLSAALPYLATVAVVYMLVRFTFRKKRHERSNEK